MYINYEMTCCVNSLVKSLPSYVSGAETELEEQSMMSKWKLERLRQKEYLMVSFALLHTNRQSRWYTWVMLSIFLFFSLRTIVFFNIMSVCTSNYNTQMAALVN